MYSISEFSKKVNLTSRALRHYEDVGLVFPSYRGKNGYRFYDDNQISQIEKIQKLKSLGFTLVEVKKLQSIDESKLYNDLETQLVRILEDKKSIIKKEKEIRELLCVTEKIRSGTTIDHNQRRVFMDAVKSDVISKITNLNGEVTHQQLEFLERDKGIYDSHDKREFLEAIKKCVSFAKEKDLILGPGRGSSPASIVLYGLGFVSNDPTKYNLLPERFLKDSPDIHIDVQFEGGQEFVDYCKSISDKLNYGQINAFKMPLLNIIKNVHNRIDKPINYDLICDDDELVLNHFHSGDLEKIFCFDMSPNALVMKYENFFPGYEGLTKFSEYVNSQKIYSFVDLLNITAIWRPNRDGMIVRMARYKEAKLKDLTIKFLSPGLKEYLKPNFGQIIYHEDIMKIIQEYTEWPLEKCGYFRRDLKVNLNEKHVQDQILEFKKLAPKEIVELVLEEAPWTFCKSHIIAFSHLIKQTAVLKSLYRDVYFEEIKKWENKFGFVWDDIGIKIKGVSLLQN